MPTGAGRVHQQRREPLDPSEQDHMVDLHASLSEELLEIPVRQPVPQVPAAGDQDDLRREPEASESWTGLLDRRTTTDHLASLANLEVAHESHGASAGSRSMQHCPNESVCSTCDL